jgi:hypothetical protein
VVGTWRAAGPTARYAQVAPGLRHRPVQLCFDPHAPSPASGPPTDFLRFWVDGVVSLDLYAIFAYLSTPAGQEALPLTVQVLQGRLDMTRWMSLQTTFRSSAVRLHRRRHRTTTTVTVGELTRDRVRTADSIVVITTVRQHDVLLDVDRRILGLLSWNLAARAASADRPLTWFVRLFRAARRHPDRMKAAERSATVVVLCRRATGLHPGLRLVATMNAPLHLKRTRLRTAAVAAIETFSGLMGLPLRVLRRSFRLVYSTTGRIQDLLRNDYKAAAAHQHGVLLPCTCCSPDVRRILPDAWRDAAG